MPTFRAPRGTRDLLPAERAAMMRLEGIAATLATRYGYRPIETPLFEQTAVFERGVGEVTDVVEKELFRLAARTDEGESWALRPEPTAGIVRAYVQTGQFLVGQGRLPSAPTAAQIAAHVDPTFMKKALAGGC